MTPYIFVLLAFLADRFSKWWAAAYLAEHGTTSFNALFTLSEAYNTGIAFGMFQGVGRIIGWITGAIVFAMLIYLRRLPRSMGLVRLGLALVIGGALGNLVDRVTSGEVLDFILTPLRPGVFNVADVTIHLGMILAVWGSFRTKNSKRRHGLRCLLLKQQDHIADDG
jgi:signal peptidase II